MEAIRNLRRFLVQKLLFAKHEYSFTVLFRLLRSSHVASYFRERQKILAAAFYKIQERFLSHQLLAKYLLKEFYNKITLRPDYTVLKFTQNMIRNTNFLLNATTGENNVQTAVKKFVFLLVFIVHLEKLRDCLVNPKYCILGT